jgi:hypothetical protein
LINEKFNLIVVEIMTFLMSKKEAHFVSHVLGAVAVLCVTSVLMKLTVNLCLPVLPVGEAS